MRTNRALIEAVDDEWQASAAEADAERRALASGGQPAVRAVPPYLRVTRTVADNLG